MHYLCAFNKLPRNIRLSSKTIYRELFLFESKLITSRFCSFFGAYQFFRHKKPVTEIAGVIVEDLVVSTVVMEIEDESRQQTGKSSRRQGVLTRGHRPSFRPQRRSYQPTPFPIMTHELVHKVHNDMISPS